MAFSSHSPSPNAHLYSLTWLKHPTKSAEHYSFRFQKKGPGIQDLLAQKRRPWHLPNMQNLPESKLISKLFLSKGWAMARFQTASDEAITRTSHIGRHPALPPLHVRSKTGKVLFQVNDSEVACVRGEMGFS
ncbi:hypothetical protein CEXT_403351 [Caerostris extrusa]|uniref:Uncharacterized protein n=1 Tax=Caerostris extrusa TaxID=172846 RepID=A0AAV4XTX1_CAEEX|nr:hypothetical protein CEXT_403351 [Caerostris extrusa]